MAAAVMMMSEESPCAGVAGAGAHPRVCRRRRSCANGDCVGKATRRCSGARRLATGGVSTLSANEAFAARALSAGKMLEWDETR